MSCNYPMIRAETYKRYKNKKGGISYEAEIWGDARLYDNDFAKWALKTGRYRKIEPIGCGQCTGCLLDYSRDRATQMMAQKLYGYDGHEYPDGYTWFITCTYDNEHLKTHKYTNTDTGEIFEGISLSVKDHQDFMKRLRKHHQGQSIQFICAGEYGSKTLRPHLHYIMYGLPLDETQFTEKSLNELNQPTWRCKELEKIWKNGRVTVGRVEWRSCAYVARYTLKKAFKKDMPWYYAQGMHPEFIIWSNGIGKDYFQKNYKKIYETDTVPINSHMGSNLKTPKSYDRMLEQIDPELMAKVKAKRQAAAKSSELALRWQTDLTPQERRKMQEARMLQIMKDIRTDV